MLKFKTIFEPIIDEDSCSCPNCKQFVKPYKPVEQCIKCGCYIDFSFMGWSKYNSSKVILDKLQEIINEYESNN